jgi:Transposase DDE domain
MLKFLSENRSNAMSDSRRVYRAIKKSVKQLYPEEPKGNLARHLETLVFMISGIIAGKSCQLPKIASKVPGDVHPDSRTKQMSRWVQNAHITFDLYFLPFVQPLLERLAAVRPLVLIMDGSAVARGCVTLMVSVLYAHRAIPIGWLVIEGEKGHFPTETHLALVREVKARVPATATVIFLGDGEFDSPELQAEVEAYAWEYVCRTAKNIQIRVDEEWLSLADLSVTRGQRVFRKRALFTNAAYGPVMVIAWWGARYKEPIYLVSNMTSVQRACDWYRKRMHIETFFSDQKSRGFQLDRSHLSDPERVQRLMFAAGLAYLWVIYLGTVVQEDDWLPVIHRTNRCDLSLFQLGLRLLDYLLCHDRPIPSSFALDPETVR